MIGVEYRIASDRIGSHECRKTLATLYLSTIVLPASLRRRTKLFQEALAHRAHRAHRVRAFTLIECRNQSLTLRYAFRS